METIIGIDLGTTNSEVAAITDGTVRVIDGGDGPIVPSCVGIDAGGNLLVGQAAKNQLVVRPESTVLSIKRKMGGDETVMLGDRQFTPQEISAVILRDLKKRAEAFLGAPVSKAVITVPAYFNDRQRNATRDAGTLAGLDVVRIVNEPTAASLAYDAGHTANEIVLVYDLGGGTFDASLVVIENGIVEVKASHGDTQLGGDDFDRLLLEFAAEELRRDKGVDAVSELRSQRRLLVASEKAKRELSDAPFARIREEFLVGDAHCDIEISRERYEDMIRPFIRKTLDCVHQCLRDASMLPSALQKIILVGGASRTPLVQRMLEEELGREPRFEINPDLIVSMGAAILGGRLAGLESSAILVDITPYTFGTSAVGELNGEMVRDRFVPVIHRNTPLPVHKAEAFATLVDNQESVKVKIYQGEEPLADDNILVGEFMISGLRNVPAGNEILLHCDLDVNGILKVTATEKESGLSKTVTMDTRRTNAVLDLDAARDNLADLYGEEEAEEAEFEEAGGEVKREGDSPSAAIRKAKELRKRAEKLLERLDGDDAEELRKLLNDSKARIESGDRAGLEKLNESLSDMLFYLED